MKFNTFHGAGCVEYQLPAFQARRSKSQFSSSYPRFSLAPPLKLQPCICPYLSFSCISNLHHPGPSLLSASAAHPPTSWSQFYFPHSYLPYPGPSLLSAAAAHPPKAPRRPLNGAAGRGRHAHALGPPLHPQHDRPRACRGSANADDSGWQQWWFWSPGRNRKGWFRRRRRC